MTNGAKTRDFPMTQRLLRRSSLGLIALVAVGATWRRSQSSPTRSAFEAFADTLRDAHGLPALAIAVVRADSTLGRAAVGRRRIDRRDEVTVADYWHIASLTKGVTASMIGVVVDRGLLRWTTTIAEVFPELRASMSAPYRDVTLAQLLSHTGGIQPYNTYAEMMSLPDIPGAPRDQRLEFVRRLLRQPPHYEPGSSHQYSNAGYTVAAAMAERVTGKPWETLIQNDLMRPLGVGVRFDWVNDGTHPSGHIKNGSRFERHDPPDGNVVPALVAPAGGVTVTIDGYAAFMRAHLRGLSGRDGVLKSATVQMLHTPVAPLPASDTLSASALGWGKRMTQWGRADGHAGNSGTFGCIVQLLVDQDLGFVVCTNASGGDVFPSAESILDSLRRRYATRTAGQK